MKAQKGFTLIELMVVIAIIAIIARIAIPSFSGWFASYEMSKVKQSIEAEIIEARKESKDKKSTVEVNFLSDYDGVSLSAVGGAPLTINYVRGFLYDGKSPPVRIPASKQVLKYKLSSSDTSKTQTITIRR